ncbi:DUF4174 domain-containing protein [Winogradskyella sp. DF17]|uniref:DUF4174 domain-containing protein n=2 Tax=Winogradskyella pelagia TaxID=2819984 RepID=A0ABS3T065_9FLAO|nr:DUF4174 domain-containing protein [Winogradskyella sp. DF17]
MHSINSQNLESFKWKNRLLLVLTSNTKSTAFTRQLKILETESKGLEERKLLVFKISPYLEMSSQEHNDYWITDSKVFKKYNSSPEEFKVILIGLDGGIKLEQNTVLTAKNLFTLIDGMPMRRTEIRKN